MKLFDLYKIGDSSQTVWENECQIDVKRLAEAGYGAQFFACYLWWEDRPFLGSHYKDALKMTEIFYKGREGMRRRRLPAPGKSILITGRRERYLAF